MRTVLAALLFAAAVARAAPATPAQRLRADAEERARAEIADLFRSLCPEQCLLLSVRARVEDEPVGQGDPGFEALAGGRAPVLRGVAATVLVDERLPSAFRTRVKTLVTERLGTLGAPATVAVDRVGFPVRNPPHLEAREPAPATPEPPPPAAAPAPPQDRALERLADAAPLLAVVALLALAVVALGFLLFFAARRPPEAALALEPEPAVPQGAAPGASAAAPGADFPAARARRLAKALADERPLRNAVVREALSRGEATLVARWVRELGDFLVADVRHDPALEAALQALAAELVRPAPADGADGEALRVLEGRVAAARLARPADAAEDAFAFLEGVRPDLFAAACAGATPGTAEVALRYAPAALRRAALETLPQARREELAVGWATRPEISTEYALAAADELRAALARTSGGAAQADRVLADVLDGLPREEQDALVARVAAQAGPRAAALLTESALAHAPDELVAAAALSVPEQRLLDYLAGADAELRGRVVAACPPRVRAVLEEELGMERAATHADFLAARRELLAALRDEAARRGVPAAALRATGRPRLVEPQ